MSTSHDEVRLLSEERDRLQSRLPAYSTRLLYLLMTVMAIEAADRTILATVMEDVKHTFGVSDGQLGLLTSAYAVVAALSVVPIGILADRWNRVRIVALGLIPWALAMGWTGAATSFAMMFIARMFLGTVEATAGPTAPSLLGDYYAVERRSRLFGILSVGTLVGALLGFGVAGAIAGTFGWRSTFFVWGAVGLVMSAVVIAVMPEPARGLPDAIHRVHEKLARAQAQAAAAEGDEVPPTATPIEQLGGGVDYRKLGNREAVRIMLRIPTLWILYAALALGEFVLSGLSIWAPTFFRRYHGFSAAGGGAIVSLLALSMVGGVIVGARLGDRFITQERPRARIRLAAWANIALAAFLVPAFWLGPLILAAPLFIAAGFCLGLPMAPLQAVGLDVLVPHLRGRAQSVRSLMRVGGTALAPLLFGFLSDAFSLRTAFVIIAPTTALSGLILFLAARSYEHDMAVAQEEAHRQFVLEETYPDGNYEGIPAIAGIPT